MKELTRMSIEYAKNRRQFNRPIAEFEMIQEKIAGMMERTWAAESMTYLTSSMVDRGGIDYSLESAMCKVFASEALWWVVNETMQIAGGLGYSKEYPYERALRDARINLIFEGTNEILRAFIALAGMQSFGEYLRDVGKALRDPIKGFGLLTDFAVHRIMEAVATQRIGEIHPALSAEVDRFETYAKELHTHAERQLMKRGKSIIDAQLVQHRLSDAAIDLYAMISVLSRTDTDIRRKGLENVEDEVTLTKLFVEQAWRRVRRNLRLIDSEAEALRQRVAGYAYEKEGYVLDYV
jgi:acyl-CoA dehydrogenase family protein 9